MHHSSSQKFMFLVKLAVFKTNINFNLLSYTILFHYIKQINKFQSLCHVCIHTFNRVPLKLVTLKTYIVLNIYVNIIVNII